MTRRHRLRFNRAYDERAVIAQFNLYLHSGSQLKMLHYTPGQGDPVSAGNPDGAGYFMRFLACHRCLPPISNKEIIAQMTAS
ncbi:protein of unknown function [Candidatus Promineifilum breve]|uniref:Uncharacterized protein n=1 Tax=Candidatus Promineifilum breve TaxID=1806508 RepID=A0A160T4T7_9CHLR|nr:protein of unknown function [Candidatus Promineifilum breve]